MVSRGRSPTRCRPPDRLLAALRIPARRRALIAGILAILVALPVPYSWQGRAETGPTGGCATTDSDGVAPLPFVIESKLFDRPPTFDYRGTSGFVCT